MCFDPFPFPMGYQLGMPAVSSMIRKVACMSGDPGGEGAGSAEMDQLPRGWYGKQVLKVQRPRIHGLVVGKIRVFQMKPTRGP